MMEIGTVKGIVIGTEKGIEKGTGIEIVGLETETDRQRGHPRGRLAESQTEMLVGIVSVTESVTESAPIAIESESASTGTRIGIGSARDLGRRSQREIGTVIAIESAMGTARESVKEDEVRVALAGSDPEAARRR
jgi:hypothetical protein